MAPQWQDGTVIHIVDETKDTRRFWIKAKDIFDFIPGQFITMLLPIHEEHNKCWRSYSIASSPDNSDTFELIVVLDPNGKGSSYLFNSISVGSIITFKGPMGVFVLKEPLPENLIFICTGTGIAPFRSMINHIKNKNIPHKNIHLIFGCRTKDNILYHDEMNNINMDGFTYSPTLSRETWDGLNGYVHNIYEPIYTNNQPAKFYICGWKGMIDEARNKIINLGYTKKDIHVEVYGQ